MQRLSSTILLFCSVLLITSCRNGLGGRAYYEYQIDSTAEVYAFEAHSATRLVDLQPGSTVIVRGRPKVGAYTDVIYNDYQVRVFDPVWQPIKQVKYKRPKVFRTTEALPRYSFWSADNKTRTKPAVHAYDLIQTRNSYRGGSSAYSGRYSSGYLPGYTPSTGATIHTGPRGGRYYFNSNGNKTYLKRSSSYYPSGSSYRSRSSSPSRSYRSSSTRSYRSSGRRR